MGGSYTGTSTLFLKKRSCFRDYFASLLSGRGNIVPAAEFNFYHDPEAVFIVLNYLKCPMTILPLETDENLHLTLVCKKWNDQNDEKIFCSKFKKFGITGLEA